MRSLVRILVGAVIAVGAGCSLSDSPKPPDLGGEDGKLIAELVDRMNDDGGRREQLKAMFAAGTPVGAKEAKTFTQYRFDLKGKPSVSGTDATATVVIEKHSGGNPVEKEWTFVKEGDKWKIKSAPLP